MSTSFKVGRKVTYRTPRGAQEGLGKIINIIEGKRGLWYEVRDLNTGATVSLRAANLELA